MTIDSPSSSSAALVLLLQRTHQGDEDAFRELYALTHRSVARVVTGTLRSPEHSAEVVQEVYLYVWQNASSFDEVRGSVLGWILMLARRRAVDRVRHVAGVVRRDHRDAAAADDTTPDVADIGLARHEADQLRRAVRRLTDRQRDAVVLTFLHGYTHEQAAALLRIPLGTLKTRVRAGVLSLRDHLEALAA
ncbi:MAG: sigma-70 family RNA polymerase sigma factor [Janthinobacterium lividum]